MPSLPVPVSVAGFTAALDLAVLYVEGGTVVSTDGGYSTIEVSIPDEDLPYSQAISAYLYSSDPSASGNPNLDVAYQAHPMIDIEDGSSSDSVGGSTIRGFKFFVQIPDGVSVYPGIVYLRGPVYMINNGPE